MKQSTTYPLYPPPPSKKFVHVSCLPKGISREATPNLNIKEFKQLNLSEILYYTAQLYFVMSREINLELISMIRTKIATDHYYGRKRYVITCLAPPHIESPQQRRRLETCM